MDNKFKTIQVYSEYISASFDKQILEDAGIFCVLQDEHTITMNWMYGNALGGIKLNVRECDYLQALDLLEEKWQEEEKINIGEKELDDSFEMSLDPTNEVCPFCGSRNTKRQTFDKKPTFVSYLFLGFPWFFKSDKTYCFNCRREFTSKKD